MSIKKARKLELALKLRRRHRLTRKQIKHLKPLLKEFSQQENHLRSILKE